MEENQSSSTAEKLCLSRRQWLALGISCLCGGVCAFAFSGAGIGLTILLMSVQLTGWWLCRRKPDAGTLFLMICAMLMAAAYALFGNAWMKALNFPVAAALTVQSLFALSGQHDALSAQGVQSLLHRFFPAFFQHWGVPWRALHDLRDKSGRMRGIGLGIVFALPLSAVVLLLLCSADEVFGDLIAQAAEALSFSDPGFFPAKVLVALVLTQMIFSLLYSLSQPPRKAGSARREVPLATCLTVLAPLCAVELVFVYVQLRYLFGGAQTAAMQGGYAQYARSGFFQLAAVSGLNLTAVLTALSVRGDRRFLRGACALLCGVTAVILFSAAWRMRLYVQVYGLTLLRLLTIWAMAMIALALGLTLYKCIRPGAKICAVLLSTVLAGWVALNFINVDAFIARWNVRAWQNGSTEALDLNYLSQLSPDVLPFLEEQDRELMMQQWEQTEETWFAWDASKLKLKGR